MEQQTWLNFVTTLQAHNIFINFRYRRSDRLLKNVLLGLVSNYTLNVFVMLHRVLTMHTQLEYLTLFTLHCLFLIFLPGGFLALQKWNILTGPFATLGILFVIVSLFQFSLSFVIVLLWEKNWQQLCLFV